MQSAEARQDALWDQWERWCHEKGYQPQQAYAAAMIAFMHHLTAKMREQHMESAWELLGQPEYDEGFQADGQPTIRQHCP